MNKLNVHLKVSLDSDTLTAQEKLFKDWHRILLGYAICNVVFIIVCVLIISGINSKENAVTETEEIDNTIFTKESLINAIQLQKYQTLVDQGIITLPGEISFER